MEFAYTDKVEGLRGQIQDFMDTHIVPRIQDWRREVHAGTYPVSFMEELKTTARQQGLWNLFLPGLKPEEPGTPLTNLEYAPLAEIMGRISWAQRLSTAVLRIPATWNSYTCLRPRNSTSNGWHRF